MGLLKRKQQAPIIGTRNPTGLPSAPQQPDDALSNASKMAAQAAASLAHSHQQQQSRPSQPIPLPPTQKTHINIMTTSPSVRPQPVPRRMSRHIVNSTSSRSIASQKRNSYVSTSSSPVYMRTAATAPSGYETSIENLSLQGPSEDERVLSHPLNVASLAAQSAALASSEFLAPPTAYKSSYISSPSSMASSAHSIDSPPFHAKLGLSRSDDFFATLNRSESALSDTDHRDIKDLDDFEWLDRSATSLRSSSSVNRPSKSSFGTNLRPDLYSGDVPHTIEEYEEFENDEDDIREYDYDRGRQFSATSIDGTLDSDVDLTHTTFETLKPFQQQQQLRRPVPLRKPPPVSPTFGSSSDIFLATPTTVPARAPSPRRKPPPDYSDDTQVDDSMMNSEVDDEVLPQYPLTTEDMKKHKHRSHGLRKGAKKILQKGFKGASYTPSNFLNESETSLVAVGSGTTKPVHLKTTMRKEKKKEKFNEDKPWKHHTDTAFVSEQERKRYEGVWVSNKGLYMDRLDPSVLIQDAEVPGQLNTALKASMVSMKSDIGAMEANLMVNVVVREVWARSKLPADTLRHIWELVDTRHDGTMDRTSFIVGMWLVDQCLYGRKLPRELSDAVWNSVTTNGLNVVLKRKKK